MKRDELKVILGDSVEKIQSLIHGTKENLINSIDSDLSGNSTIDIVTSRQNLNKLIDILISEGSKLIAKCTPEEG